ncbi:prepilin-type N-terminal cleavage/methylation domain-containing protein [Candidatus Dojkabacteria bacterium]|nr:prepilin-type N-terminal cleavage/methylation domain-containing protein [Candidatus Dojkabacteria bacterium]
MFHNYFLNCSQMNIKTLRNEKGFTLLEVLLVVAIIAILAGIVILALNPGKQIDDTNDSERSVDVNTILNAVWQYSLDNDGTLPSGITSTSTEICATGAASCTGLVDLSVLTTGETFLVSIPEDPEGGIDANGTGYEIATTSGGRVTVTAPQAVNSTVSVSR